MNRPLKEVDPEVYDAIGGETRRQAETLELIASENFTSEAVLEATGSVFTNKYAEGYPGRRYYGGCEFVDVVETLARERAKRLFGAEHANVQPHSGTQANIAVYETVLKEGDPVLGMDLSHGGHLSHGHPLNFSGKHYRFIPYGVRRDTETIDYDKLEQLAREHQPKLLVAGASAYPRTMDFERMAAITRAVGCLFMMDMAHIAGLIAAGVHPSPVPHADFVTTTTHKTLRGPRSGLILCREEFAKALDKTVFPGEQGGPLVHVIAAKAVCLKEAMEPEFAAYQRQIVANARKLADTLAARGFRVVSGGTDTHLLLVDVYQRGIMGRDAEAWLEKAGITVNKNAIPFDQLPPLKASGIRIGTPALTSRGMQEPEMELIGNWMADALEHMGDGRVIERIRGQVRELTSRFPLYTLRLEEMQAPTRTP
ncbi:MAG: serine hydroxymethyltransferase [Acidobacteria bacterium]|nr:serine hydroxymethyltransferase [Acidobacteriota bacterium]